MNSSVLIREANAIWTGAADLPRIDGASLRIDSGRISAIGTLEPKPGEEVIDARDCVVAPGWVNTHHHFFQSLLKAVPGGVGVGLTEWSPAVSARFRHVFDEQLMRCAAQVALGELVRSGCTTIADHHFLNYPGIGFDSSAIIFEEAQRLGVRLVLCRGGATYSAATPATNALRPEYVEDFLTDVERLVGQYHDPNPHSYRRIAIAPTLISSRVQRQDLVQMAEFGRRLGLRMHSHLNETDADNAYCREVHGCSAVELCADTGWIGSDVWFAHMVRMQDDELRTLSNAGVGWAHCPRSNARLRGGVAPMQKMLQHGMRVSIGVDGAGSNESADMLSELNFCWHMHNAHFNDDAGGHPGAPAIADVVQWASSGGADILGLDVGRLKPGAIADLGVYRFDDIGHAGLHDLASGLVLSAQRPSLVRLFCGGNCIVQDGIPIGIDLEQVTHDAKVAVRRMRAAVPT